MNDADTLGVLVILLCLVGSMFFSGSETAITSFGERRARRAVEEGEPGAHVLRLWVKDPVYVLSTILVGNNITNTLMGSVATAIAIRHLGGGEYGEYAVPVAVVLTTGLLLVFGEIMPKALGQARSTRFAVPALVGVNAFGKLAYPVTWVLTKLTNLMLARTVNAEQQAVFRRVTADELDFLVRLGRREGSLRADQADLLQGIFRFQDKVVRDIMVPRDRVTAVDLSDDAGDALAAAQRSGHSRLPAYERDLDNVVGTLHIKVLVGLGPSDRDRLRSLLRPTVFVSESMYLQDLLRRFREQRSHLAVVVDDAGHTVGVVTLEDVLEQIVGQIFDESDLAPAGGVTAPPGVYSFDAQASLARVEELFEVDFGELEDISSIGDLLTQLAGRIPSQGSVFVYESVRFVVMQADAKRVERVTVERLHPLSDTED